MILYFKQNNTAFKKMLCITNKTRNNTISLIRKIAFRTKTTINKMSRIELYKINNPNNIIMLNTIIINSHIANINHFMISPNQMGMNIMKQSMTK